MEQFITDDIISIHAPRTGSDARHKVIALLPLAFQSTLPARGATNHARTSQYYQVISIHAPRTGSDLTGAILRLIAAISIHAPRTGSDSGACRFTSHHRDFNPRSPHGERLLALWRYAAHNRISIHAPRTGSDDAHCGAVAQMVAFQSTLPARGATLMSRGKPCFHAFQSTLPARGATML